MGMGQDLPRGAPIGMSIFCLCFVSTIEILGYPILTHTHLLFCFGKKKKMRLSGYVMGYYMGNIKNKVDISAIYVQAMPMLGNHWGMGHWNICHGICGIYILKGYSMIFS